MFSYSAFMHDKSLELSSLETRLEMRDFCASVLLRQCSQEKQMSWREREEASREILQAESLRQP